MNALPQILVITLSLIGLLLESNKHGQQKEGRYNIWSSVIAAIIYYSILIWGGFFNNLLNN